jgi:hypothetical protein
MSKDKVHKRKSSFIPLSNRNIQKHSNSHNLVYHTFLVEIGHVT